MKNWDTLFESILMESIVLVENSNLLFGSIAMDSLPIDNCTHYIGGALKSCSP
jgi:hypothetical protein